MLPPLDLLLFAELGLIDKKIFEEPEMKKAMIDSLEATKNLCETLLKTPPHIVDKFYTDLFKF